MADSHDLDWADVSAIKSYPQSPRRHVPGNIARPTYVGLGDVPETYDGSHVQSAETIAAMEEAGRIACGAMHELSLIHI